MPTATQIQAAKAMHDAQEYVAHVANEITSALRYFVSAQNTRNADEYREDVRELLDALDDWKAKSQAFIDAVRAERS